MKTHIILASHGSLAEGMVTAVRMVIRDLADDILALGLDQWETPQVIRAKVELLMKEHPQDQYIILCDIKGGSVANELMTLCIRSGVTLVTGMNLALVISLVLRIQNGMVCGKEQVDEILEEVVAGICCYDASDFKQSDQEGDGELW